jgi:hypothetical protein
LSDDHPEPAPAYPASQNGLARLPLEDIQAIEPFPPDELPGSADRDL